MRADVHKTSELFQMVDDYGLENSFIESVREFFQRDAYITQAQFDKIEEILEEFKVDNDLL